MSDVIYIKKCIYTAAYSVEVDNNVKDYTPKAGLIQKYSMNIQKRISNKGYSIDIQKRIFLEYGGEAENFPIKGNWNKYKDNVFIAFQNIFLHEL